MICTWALAVDAAAKVYADHATIELEQTPEAYVLRVVATRRGQRGADRRRVGELRPGRQRRASRRVRPCRSGRTPSTSSPSETSMRPRGRPAPSRRGRAWCPARPILIARSSSGSRIECASSRLGQEISIDGEISRTKALGQIYVDRSQKQWPDDFPDDLAALTPATECATCARREALSRRVPRVFPRRLHRGRSSHPRDPAWARGRRARRRGG